MQLRILDQVHLSGVRTSTLAAGELVEVSRVLGDQLLQKHPDKFELVSEDDALAEEKSAPAPIGAGKAEDAPANKAEDAPANKSDKPARRKRGEAKAD